MSSRSKFTEDQVSEFQEMFGIFDSRGDQMINVTQIGDVLRACGQNPTELEWKKYVGNDPDKRMNFNEFLPILQDVEKNKPDAKIEDFIEGLKVFDKEQNGFINAAELRNLLCNSGEKMTEEECELLFQGHEDPHGNINYEELIDYTVNGRPLF